jgi:hypothetical protein
MAKNLAAAKLLRLHVNGKIPLCRFFLYFDVLFVKVIFFSIF